jgi:3-dehydroquinate dehydratase type I
MWITTGLQENELMRTSLVNNRTKPQTVTIITDPTPDGCIATMRNAAYDGTDAYGFMLDFLDLQYHNKQDLQRMFAYAADKPILTMNYRNSNRIDRGQTDQDMIDTQLLAIESGATMVDIIADYYDPSPRELSRKPKIIDQQRKLVDQIHSMGGEVLMSSHTWDFLTAEETLEHFHQLELRGGDMVKIAMCASSEDELLETIKATMLARRELKMPFLHVCMGQYGKIHRVISTMFGSALALCVQEYTSISHKEQPLLRSTKAVLENLDYRIARDDTLGTIKGKHKVQ